MPALSLRTVGFRHMASRAFIPVCKAPAFQTRAYADNNPSRGSSTRGEPGATTNIRSTPSSHPESSEINANRATDGGSPDTASIQNPVSNPGQTGIGGQEEPQPSQENIMNDPEEPADVRRSKVEKEGQRPLDPADK